MTYNSAPVRQALDALDVSHAADMQAANDAFVQVQADLTQAQNRPAAVTVVAGDTFSKYAADYGMTVARIAFLNPDVDPNAMQIGSTVWLVEPGTVPAVDPPPDPPPPDPEPEPGQAFLFGHVALHGSGTWLQKAQAAEAKYGKFPGPMRDYYQPGDDMKPKADHKAWLDSDPDHTLLINIKPGSTWSTAGTGSNVAVIQAAMTAWKVYIEQGRVRFIVWHEPENDGKPFADYIPMWKRVVGIMRGVASSVLVGFCPISFYPGTSKTTAYYAQNFYAGPEWVDFFAPDPYTVKGAPPSRLPENMINQAKVLRALPGASAKKLIAAEWGPDLGGQTTDRGTDQHRADSITAVKNALPDLVANGYEGLTYYDDGSDYLSASGPDVPAYRGLKAAAEALVLT